jgi:hypothetical protein
MWKSAIANFRSWKTTAVGLLGCVVVLLDALHKCADGNVATNPDWNVVVAAFTTLWLAWHARDADKTDQQSGLRPEKK